MKSSLIFYLYFMGLVAGAICQSQETAVELENGFNQQLTLLTLPKDILFEIGQYLPKEDIAHFGEVSRFSHDVVMPLFCDNFSLGKKGVFKTYVVKYGKNFGSLSWDIAHVGSIRPLNIKLYRITPHNIDILCGYLHNVTALDISACGIKDKGATILASSINVVNLTFLDLSSCQIDGQGAKDVFQSPYLTKLESLRIGHNQLTDSLFDDCKITLSNLTELNLASNQLSAIGCKKLIQWHHFTNLKNLSLPSNPIGFNGLTELVILKKSFRLRELDLFDTRITHLDIRSILQNPAMSTLVKIDARQNPITDEEMETLRQDFPVCNFV